MLAKFWNRSELGRQMFEKPELCLEYVTSSFNVRRELKPPIRTEKLTEPAMIASTSDFSRDSSLCG
jgi:hypothetical protein